MDNQNPSNTGQKPEQVATANANTQILPVPQSQPITSSNLENAHKVPNIVKRIVYGVPLLIIAVILWLKVSPLLGLGLFLVGLLVGEKVSRKYSQYL